MPPSTSVSSRGSRSDLASAALNVLAPGNSTSATVTFANNSKVAVSNVSLSLAAPDVWTISPLTATTKSTLPKGASATYQVTEPATVTEPISTATLTGDASYYSDATGTTSTTAPIDVTLVSPIQAPYQTANTTGTPAQFGQVGSTLAISAAGANVGPASFGPGGGTPAGDAYGAIYVPGALNGDGTVEVVIASQGSAGSKSGIMVRTDMDAGGTNVEVGLAVSGGRAEIDYNNSVGGGTAYTTRLRPNIGTFANPVHLRLVRSGATYTGFSRPMARPGPRSGRSRPTVRQPSWTSACSTTQGLLAVQPSVSSAL